MKVKIEDIKHHVTVKKTVNKLFPKIMYTDRVEQIWIYWLIYSTKREKIVVLIRVLEETYKGD